MLINVNGLDIDYRDTGGGFPVIFIHAFPLNQTMWDDQLFALQSHCRVITLDLRGFGRSTAPGGPYLMEQMAADVRGLMSSLGISKAAFVGLSMGGYVTLAFYRNYHELVSAMVLADTRATADTEEARQRRLKSAVRAENEGSRAIAEDMIPLLLGSTTIESRPSITERVRAMIEANSPIGIAAAQRGMSERRDSTDLLQNIDIPVLVVVGTEDKLTPVAEAESMHNGIPGAQLRIIDAAGHLSNLENPEKFNREITEFLTTL